MKLLLLADIHANVTAFDAVMAHATENYGEELAIMHLGDAIDYGMRPNETMDRLIALENRLHVNLAGNHERALLGFEMERFSSARGAAACSYTGSILEGKWLDYIRSEMQAEPCSETVVGKKLLFVHGHLDDPFWGKMSVSEAARDCYRSYDYVISAHTHVPFLFEAFYSDDSVVARRGKKRTVFINPGSVGQPRNHNPAAQYGLLDLETGSMHFNAVAYDYHAEIALYHGEIDLFYADRLGAGI